MSRIWTTTFEQKDWGDEIRNSMAPEKHLRELTKNSFVGRILKGEPEHDSYVILVFWPFWDLIDVYKKKIIKNTPSI